jgi:hypothetical protein
MNDDDARLDAIFSEWAAWVRTKRLYSPSPNPKSIIGRLRLQQGLSEPPDAALSPEMARLHLAIMAAGDRGNLIVAEFLHRPTFRHMVGRAPDGEPIYRRRMIKEMAAAAGIRNESWRRSVRRACRDVYARSQAIILVDENA